MCLLVLSALTVVEPLYCSSHSAPDFFNQSPLLFMLKPMYSQIVAFSISSLLFVHFDWRLFLKLFKINWTDIFFLHFRTTILIFTLSFDIQDYVAILFLSHCFKKESCRLHGCGFGFLTIMTELNHTSLYCWHFSCWTDMMRESNPIVLPIAREVWCFTSCSNISLLFMK